MSKAQGIDHLWFYSITIRYSNDFSRVEKCI